MKNIESFDQYNEKWFDKIFKRKDNISKEEVEGSKHFMKTFKSHPEYTKTIRFALSNMNHVVIKPRRRQSVIDEIALWIGRLQRNYKYITDDVLAKEYNAFLTPTKLGL